ncbi:MAG: DNA polymerase III subunit delta', partial [Pseudomonadota bacterium]|nr:DNA polymerase III subunit delta' [Pseudomonadota bacterium]
MTELAPWLTDAYQQAQAWRRQSRFHHALLVSGINGVGQSEFAQQVTQLLLCGHPDKAPCGTCHSCQVAKADTHPDWLVL